MLDYVVKETELSKGITLSEYIKLKGLTEDNWLLIKDYHTGKLITGVRADGLTGSEKDYYVVIVENYIFPQYTEHSERPYYIVVYISKTPVDFIPVVHTSVEVEKVEAPEENTSGPEQPAEEDEEQENPEQIPAEENQQDILLTPLESILFELDSNSLKSYYGFCDLSELAEKQGLDDKIIEQYEANASLERHYVDLLRYIIKQAELQKKHLLWLAERKKHEALEAKNIWVFL